MNTLEDIPKNNPFSVPEGYFDKLPGVIQARVAETSVEKPVRPFFRYAFRIAVPVVAVAVIAILYFTPSAGNNYNDILASVDTEQLTAYLEESDITVDELLDATELDEESVEAIETEVYFNDIDIENLSDFDL